MRLSVEGMTCGHCTSTVQSVLEGFEGVVASVDLESGSAEVGVRDGFPMPNVGDMVDAIEAIGFDAREASAVVSEKKTFVVKGMRCEQCEKWLVNALREVNGVTFAEADHAAGSALVTGTANATDVENAVRRAGFTTSKAALNASSLKNDDDDEKENTTKADLTATISVTGMTCAACSSRVERALTKVEGIRRASVNALTDAATVTVSDDGNAKLVLEGASEAIKTTGFGVDGIEIQKKKKKHDDDSKSSARLAIVSGIVCEACPGRVERGLKVRLQVSATAVNFNSPKSYVDVVYDPHLIGAHDIRTVLEDMGYAARVARDDYGTDEEEVVTTSSEKKKQKLARTADLASYFRDAVLAASLAVPVALCNMVMPLAMRFENILLFGKVHLLIFMSFLFATPVQFFCGRRFYAGAYAALKNYSANMDVLVALGSSAAYFYSTAVFLTLVFHSTSPFAQEMAAYDTSALLVAFVLVGKFLEAGAKGATSKALRELMTLQPTEAVVLDRKSRKETSLMAAALRRGDCFKVRPGDRVPADGFLVSWSSATRVDESLITGEAVPVVKKPGDGVVAGTVNAGPAALVALVSAVGEDTMLAGVVNLVERAQGDKTKVEASADIVARHFVVVVVVVSLMSFCSWYFVFASRMKAHPHSDFLFSFLFGVAVLVVACPCALGLATPTAVMCGTGVGASRGILFRSGGLALEIAHAVDAVVFDKTGTLTKGEPSVSDVEAFDQREVLSFLETTMKSSKVEAMLLGLVAATESDSEHPVAKAICKASRDKKLLLPEVRNFESLVGRGVSATLEFPATSTSRKKTRVNIHVGTRELMGDLDSSVFDGEDQVALLETQAKTVVLVHVGAKHRVTADSTEEEAKDDQDVDFYSTSENGAIVGLIALSDVLREDAASAVDLLHRRGIEVWMITGDNDLAARAVAQSVGIFNVMSRAKPAHKAERIAELQASGRVVAHVGDGVNDSPALAQADLGVAMGAGAQLAVETADVVLVQSNLLDVAIALDIAKATFRVIKLNLFCSLVFNAIAIPAAAGLFYPLTHTQLPPELAAIAMTCSSIAVVTASLSLRSFRPREDVRLLQDQLLQKKMAQQHGDFGLDAAEKGTITDEQKPPTFWRRLLGTLRPDEDGLPLLSGAMASNYRTEKEKRQPPVAAAIELKQGRPGNNSQRREIK